MSYLVVGTRDGDGWSVEVQGVGTTTAADLSSVEPAARALLVEQGHTDGGDADLQLLLPDFEVDLQRHGIGGDSRPHRELLAGGIALAVVIGAAAFVLGLLFG